LSEVLRWSSNIGIVKFTERLNAREEFETLRDFGFGTATGVPFPSEAGGILRSPKSWSKQSANSLAMGYEISATPLQLALAYATFANGGELVEPALVKKIVAPDGTVRFEHKKRVVRQVVSRRPRTRFGGFCSKSSRGNGKESGHRQLHPGGQDGDATRDRPRPLRPRAPQPELRRALSGRQSAVRDRG
jgi:cell division protein FtsI (penicillin-binding protein 3)